MMVRTFLKNGSVITAGAAIKGSMPDVTGEIVAKGKRLTLEQVSLTGKESVNNRTVESRHTNGSNGKTEMDVLKDLRDFISFSEAITYLGRLHVAHKNEVESLNHDNQ